MSNESIAYVWIPETKTIAEFDTNGAQTVPKEFLGKYCVDNNFSTGATSRYGMWNLEVEKWVHIPFEDFPIEFKTNLLLLGIV